MGSIEIGRLLRASTADFVLGCRVSQSLSPAFGALVSVPQPGDYTIFGLIYDIHIDDDGLVRQLVTVESVEESIIADNRLNRNVPLEISVLSVGYQQDGRIYHLLPPRPPLSLDVIYLCEFDEIRRFTAEGRFGYLRHVLRQAELPVGELLAAHIRQTQEAHSAAGNHEWGMKVMQEIITLLRDDYPVLMQVLSALGDAIKE